MEKKKLKLFKPPYKLIYLEWDDAVGNSRWFGLEEAEEWLNNSQWLICETGFLISEDRKAIYLCAFWKPLDTFSDEQMGSLRRIPKNWIKKRIDLTNKIK